MKNSSVSVTQIFVNFFQVGRATAIAALDITDTNPWSRLAGTDSGSVHGVRAWVQRYLRSMRGAPSLPKKMSRVASKTSRYINVVSHLIKEKYSIQLYPTDWYFCNQNNGAYLHVGNK